MGKDSKLDLIDLVVIGVVVFVALVVLGAYFIFIAQSAHFKISSDQAIWGQFGDYIGCLMNPVVSMAALWFVFKAWVLQKREFKSFSESAQTQNFDTTFFHIV